MEEKPKTEIQDKEGIPAEKQVSKETESTESQKPKFDLSTEITIDKVGNKATLNDVISGFHRGRLFDQTQSELQKTQGAYKKLQEEHDEVQARLAKIEQASAIQSELEKLGIAKKSEDVDSESSWLTEGDNKLDQEVILKQLNQMDERRTQELYKKLGVDGTQASDLKTLVNQTVNEVEADRGRVEARKTFAQNLNTARTRELHEKYGLAMDDDQIQDIIRTVSVSQALSAQAGDLSQQWDKESQDAAIENQTNANNLMWSAVDKIATAKVEQEKQEHDAELRTQLETGQFSTPGELAAASEYVDAVTGKKPNLNIPKERTRYLDHRTEEAAKKMDVIDAARRALGK